MRIGSLFAGLGGLDQGAEWAFDGRTVWQLDQVGAKVRARHFPEAIQITADVAEVDPLSLPSIDVLCAGFSCQDLSYAGKGASRGDLDVGARTGGTYRGVLRFVSAKTPEYIVLENVPALLAHRKRLEQDFAGYGLTWVTCAALDVGAPHRRQRVFVVGRRGAAFGGLIAAPIVGRWRPEDDARGWATVCASEASGRRTSIARRDDPDMLSEQVRVWGTARTGANGVGGVREDDNGRLEDHVQVHLDGVGRRLSPAWVETLMGLPIGWTSPEGPQLKVERSPRWPRGRYPDGWDRRVVWPGYPWEPSRTLPDGPPCPGRPAQIWMLGNMAVPQQVALAIHTALQPAQVGLFGAA